MQNQNKQSDKNISSTTNNGTQNQLQPKKRTNVTSEKTDTKFHHMFGLWATVLNHGSSGVRHMPLDIDNGLPGIVVLFGKTAFLCHVDSCAAMNTGNWLLHKWIMSTFPDIVVDYQEFNDPNPFEPLSLRCAVSSNKNESVSTLKNLDDCLCAVVTYKSGYQLNGQPAYVSFGLGEHISVRCILGIPFLRQWGADICLSQNKVVAHALNENGIEFPIEYAATSNELPNGINFKAEQFVRPPSQSVNSQDADNHMIGITDGCFDGMEPQMFPVSSSSYTVTETCIDGILKRTVTATKTSAAENEN